MSNEQEFSLNHEQQYALDKFVNTNDNIALFGAAGTGKSLVFKRMIQHSLKNASLNIEVTAMTGVAAVAINGKTLHSALCLGIPRDTENRDNLLNKILNNKTAKKKWMELNILFIDEISMMNGILFDKLDYVAKKINNNALPFGGIRLVVCGDFLQLKSVNSEVNFFNSKSYFVCFPKASRILFKKLMRQIDDLQWGMMLNRIRFGQQTKQDMMLLAERRVENMSEDEKKTSENAIQLYCLNRDVDEINNNKLNEMIEKGAKKMTFESSMTWKPAIPIGRVKHLEKPDVILCIGARVMHLVNDLQRNLVNGSTGIVLDLTSNTAKVRFDDGKAHIISMYKSTFDIKEGSTIVTITSEFMPLRLCWASTVHKCQGLTLTKACINLFNAFAPGQVYTALSRLPNLNSLYLKGFTESGIKTCPQAISFYESFYSLE
jgi:ATP-dependent DNA helicase PIF1